MSRYTCGPIDIKRKVDRKGLPSYLVEEYWSGGKICFTRLPVALVSVVCVIALLSGCATPYASIGGASEIQLAPDTYRVLFSPTGYISWNLAYRPALVRCAELTIENGYRYFGVTAIDNYSSATSFVPQGHGFYNAYTA